LVGARFDAQQPTAWALEGLLPYLPGAAQDALFEKLHELSAPGSWIAAELGPRPGEIAEFERDMPPDSPGRPRVSELWYDDPRRDTKSWLAENDWAVTEIDLVEAAVGYGRPFGEQPRSFETLLRTKFFTATRTS
jgi:methyltransferase (TIGR00027 family)